ncbi:MAG: hypothetical protein GY925_26620, partial [Actinomycetia bacterium]|nr:hypothetical protein [Actinomycetes bacterium]
APNLAYLLAIHTSGALRLYTSTTGSDSVTGTSTATLGSVTSAGTAVWVRATFDASTGDKEFFYSLDDVEVESAVSWTQLGATVSGTSGAIPDTTSALMAGAHGGGSSWNFSGEVYVAEVYDDGNLVERIAADDADPNASTWVSPTSGQTITANRAAAAQYHVAVIPSGVEAAQTDGVDDKPVAIGDDSVGDFDPAVGLTMAVWFRVHDGAGSYGRVLTNGDTGDNGVTIQRHATNPRFRGYLKDGTNAASPGDNVDNVTYGGQALIVAAFGSSDHEFYADGVSIETTSTAVVVETSTNPMTMGMRPDGASPLAVTIFGAAVVGRRIDDAAAVTIAAEGLGS